MSKTLTVRGVDEDVVRRLKIRAARHDRSAEAEHREILKQALASEPREDFWQAAARLRAATSGRAHTPAELLVREGRDKR
jgi:plasmid stability protein